MNQDIVERNKHKIKSLSKHKTTCENHSNNKVYIPIPTSLSLALEGIQLMCVVRNIQHMQWSSIFNPFWIEHLVIMKPKNKDISFIWPFFLEPVSPLLGKYTQMAGDVFIKSLMNGRYLISFCGNSIFCWTHCLETLLIIIIIMMMMLMTPNGTSTRSFVCSSV